ncbi:MAG TPA: hypothetical protein PKK26_04305 [Candidatus Wallbacteria bacterium]|nr:hypothetical protein [Candidatus Wallbacteria bacterium]
MPVDKFKIYQIPLILYMLIISAALLSFPDFSKAQQLTCGVCRNNIEGKYYKMEGASGEYFICLACYEKSPKCPFCKGIMREENVLDGNKMCSACYNQVKQADKCALCQKHIIGSYTRYTDASTGAVSSICQECLAKSERCSVCNIPSASLSSYEGNRLCAGCYDKISKMPVCEICKNHIAGTYVQYKDPKDGDVTYICTKCNDKTMKCSLCKVPSISLSEVQGQNVCPKCYSNLKKCYGCGKFIMQASYNYRIVEQTYCPDCQKNSPKCGVCGLPTGANPVTLTDGRKICPDCEATSVKDIATVKNLYESVAAFIVKEYSMEIGHVNAISFKEIKEMEKLGKETPTAAEGASIPLGIFSRQGDKFDIYVQENLPKNLLIGVLAHEYAHAYMHDVSPDYKNIEIEEGFAEWIRYKTLNYIGDEKGAKLIEARQDIYGDGFRKVSNIEKNEGTGGVFRLFIRKKQ